MGFDTSGNEVDVTILLNGKVMAEVSEPRTHRQKEMLFPTIDTLFGKAGISWRDISAIGVGTGPGFFNGIRVAVAAARGLSLSLGIPAIGINRFDSLAWGIQGPSLAVVELPGGLVCCKMNSEEEPFFTGLDDINIPHAKSCTIVGHEAETIARRVGSRATKPIHGRSRAAALSAFKLMGRKNPRPTPCYVKPPRVDPGANRFAKS